MRTNEKSAKTWYLFADTLELLKNTKTQLEQSPKTSGYQLASINSSIVLHLATIVEGATSSLLANKLEHSEALKKARQSNDFDAIRIYQDLLSSVYEAQWYRLSEELAKTILGFKVTECYKEDWPAIKYLFQYRNILAHGGTILNRRQTTPEIETEIRTEIGYFTKQDLFNYLFQKKLISDPVNFSFMEWEFLNSRVADFFLKHSKQFLMDLYERYRQEVGFNIFLLQDRGVILNL